ncbi:MAG TPA: hypothetical protein VI386_24380 [Candidatus Sulfotelmatobacter sp.]
MNRKRVCGWLLFSAMMMSMVVSLSPASMAQFAVGISVRIGPPALPVYEQPFCPGPGYIWTPGYWAWSDDDGYYWVPGTWVVAPVGMLWTPGYWGWNDGVYLWNAGYWGPHVGFYGGINYGFGYTGVGFYGGEWRGRDFYYNRSVTRVNVTNVTNVYNKTVIVNNNTHVAFNGGRGGVQARPTPEQERFAREPHQAPVQTQIQHERAASQNRQLFAAQNHGRPPIAATVRPAEFSGRSVVAAKAAGAPYRAPKISPREARAPVPAEHSTAGNARANTAPNNKANGAANNRSGNQNNGGFRPFTPPNKNNTAGSNNRPSAGGSNNEPNNRPANRPSNESRPAKPFTPPPSASHSSSQGSSHQGSANRSANQGSANHERPQTNEARPQSQPRESRPAQNQPRPQNESRPQSAPHPAPHEAAPAPHRESAPPQHEAAPQKPEHHPGR